MSNALCRADVETGNLAIDRFELHGRKRAVARVPFEAKDTDGRETPRSNPLRKPAYELAWLTFCSSEYVSPMTPDVEVSRSISASPEAVFSALTDITRMGEWSPETVKAEWNDSVTEAAVGAAFTGHNRNGDKEWTTAATITELVPNERFFFDCSVRDFVFAKWGYTIEPTDDGCIVREYAQDLRPESALERSAQISGVTDRLSHNRAGMEATLEGLAAALE